MKYDEISGDIFNAPRNTVLAHCVSVDCAMGITSKGERFPCIALQFRDRFPELPKFCLSMNPSVGDAIVYLGKQDLVGSDNSRIWDIYNLFTKEKYFQKPTIYTLEKSLIRLRDSMTLNGREDLAIPKLGAGADRLSWDVVRGSILRIFGNTNISITVYTL